jgi:hypothetical protein
MIKRSTKLSTTIRIIFFVLFELAPFPSVVIILPKADIFRARLQALLEQYSTTSKIRRRSCSKAALFEEESILIEQLASQLIWTTAMQGHLIVAVAILHTPSGTFVRM